MTKNTMRLLLTSNGAELPLGVGEEIDIEEISGLEKNDFIIHKVDNALIDGDEVDGKKIGPRPIHIVASFRNNRNNSERRQRLIKFFNPKYDDGDLYVNNMGVERHIHYEIEGFTFVKQENLDAKLRFVVDLICPVPYMLDIDDFGKDIAEIAPQFTFPWIVTAQKMPGVQQPYKGLVLGGKIMGYKAVKTKTGIPNKGDVPTGVVAVFNAKKGPVVNPKLINEDTGKYVRVKVSMSRGDVLIIDTDERTRKIELNGENTYHKIDRKSDMFSLAVGDTVISYDSDDGYDNLEVYMYYTPKYLGV